jgi:hypothetical protein
MKIPCFPKAILFSVVTAAEALCQAPANTARTRAERVRNVTAFLLIWIPSSF